jgi:chaperonin GroES
MLPLIPLSGRVAVRQDSASKTTEGGLILPDCAQNKPACGTVIAVYESTITKKGAIVYPQVAVGDKVIFIPYGFEKINHNDEELLLIRESDILTIWIKTPETT